MPELPEVETIKRDLHEKICRDQFAFIKVFDSRVLANCTEKKLSKELAGEKIETVDRRGKAVIFRLSHQKFLVVHLKMTGQLIVGDGKEEKGKQTRIIFQLASGRNLFYNDQRLFGRLWVVKDLKEVNFLRAIGPEPLNGVVNPLWLTKQLKLRETPIKVLLLNQEFLAGIGNIYASEILFKAKINPKKRANRLRALEVESLYRSIVSVLKEAIDYRGTSMRNYRDSAGQKGRFIDRIRVYNREGEKCFICQTPITRIVQGARSTFFCRRCQK